MEGNRRNFLNKHSNPQFKKKGVPRKERYHDSARELSSESSRSSDTVYRILCHSKKIGSVIGKGGNIVKALREETQAKITVSDSVPGSEERVIIICSPSDKRANQRNVQKFDASEMGDDIEPHCAAQDALLRVHDRIVEEDLGGAGNHNVDEPVVTARLLVSNNTVGCLLGRKGDVIQRLRSETGANIRVLPADHLPACASSNEELVQISAKPAIAKKALYEVSTLLHQNPRKDKPLGFATPYASQGFHPSGLPVGNVLRPGNSSWLERNTDAHNLSPMPWKEGHGTLRPSEFEPEGFDGITSPHDRESFSEFSMKILCSAEKIGGVIGKGGLNVRHLQQETGASVHVENVSKESDERVVRVSSYEALWDQRSQTIDAILQLQNKTSELSEKGTIITRLLVPSSKVGCILGQGGHVINEMRRRTHADIRVFSKEDKPKCASEDEELVQISGSFGVAKDALTEIASRLRTRYLRDATNTVEPAPVRPVPNYGPAGSIRGGGFTPSSAMGAGSSGRYELLKGPASSQKRPDTFGSNVHVGGFREYEPPSYPVPPRASGYSNINEGKLNSVSAMGGRRITEFTGIRAKLQDPYSAGSDFGTPERFNALRNVYQIPNSSAGPNFYPQSGSYHSYNTPHGVYPNVSPQVPYQNSNPRPVAYQNIHTQQGSYQNTSAQGSYQY